jgi:riboflavin synthase
VFTGLVEEKGTLVRREARGPGARLTIESSLGDKEPYEMGESIAIDGACLSVVAHRPRHFEVDASAETLARTTLGNLREGSRVNLERAMKLGGRMGGHIVTGHVDGVGSVAEKRQVGEAWFYAFDIPAELAPFVAEKGSIAVSGVSLTVNGVSSSRFDVVLIPITTKVTTLGDLAPGSPVNIEIDLLARYVARILQTTTGGDAALMERLKAAGYV